MGKIIRKLLISIVSICPHCLYAQSIEDLRGGWIADHAGERHIYYIVLRDDTVSGTYCHDCEDPYKLAFIDDGELTENGLNFSVYHYPRDNKPYQERVVATLVDGELHLRINTPDADTREMALHRTREADKVLLPMLDASPNRQVGPGLRNRQRVLPGPVEAITPEKVVGLWLWGTGPGKQYFIFREHKDTIRGMVCGPCDSAPDMAPLEKIGMDGTNFHFEIVHEDNGLDFETFGPHSNVTDAQVSEHEMHMSVIPSFRDATTFTPIEMTLLGPIAD